MADTTLGSQSAAQKWEVASHAVPHAEVGYRPDIDGLRAIAVLVVVAFHAAPGRMPGGFIGVDIFFVISGYLITSILLGANSRNTFSFADFYARRVRRIFPALLTVLCATLGVGYFILIDEDFTTLAKHVIGGAAFLSNFVLWGESSYFDHAADFKPLLHLWSLAIEEQYYLVWPAVLWYAFRKNLSRFWTVTFLAVLSFGANLVLLDNDPVAVFYSPLTRVWELAVGAALACSHRDSLQGGSSARTEIQSIAGMLLLGAGLLLVDRNVPFPGWVALAPVLGTALLIASGPNAWVNRSVLSNRALVFVGLISYPLYLWHWPLLSFLRILEGGEVAQWKRGLAVISAIALATATYWFLERPIRRGNARRTALYLGGAMLTVAALSAALSGREFAHWSRPAIANSGEIGTSSFFSGLTRLYFPCSPQEIHQSTGDWNGIVRCFQSKKDGEVTVALLGDSHAEHLFPGMARYLPHENVAYYARGGSPFIDNKEYEAIFKHVLDSASVHTVVLAAHWFHRVDPKQAEVWQPRLSATLSALEKAGKRVYVSDDVPTFSFEPHRCKFARRLWIETRCQEPDAQAGRERRAVLEKAATEAGLQVGRVVRTYDLFCRDGICSMASGGNLYFRDRNHLNFSGSERAAEVIVQSILHERRE